MTRLFLKSLAASAVLAASAISAPVFAADNMQTADEFRTSKLVGTKVYNSANENIGSIEDIVLKADGSMDEVVLSVGGFLGIGEKYVIVSPAAVTVAYSEADKKWSAKMDATKDEIEKAPEFKYDGRWKK